MNTKQSLLKVLICDDDPADRKLVRTYLQQVDNGEIVLLEAGQKVEIQRALDRGRVDLVLMDIQMPEKSGMKWLTEIVGKRSAPVVMLTGHGDEEIAVQSLQEGAVGYLPKSRLSTENLVQTIDAALERWRQIQQSRANEKELEILANIDSLTGLYNRRAILRRLDDEIKYTERYKADLCLLMMDIDHFKKVNDQYGHLTGDEVLEKVATLAQHSIRSTDVVGRYGGEEFVVVLPKADLSSAMNVAERIRKAIEAVEMQDSEANVFNVTISQGLSCYKQGDDKKSIVSRADDALYRAKHNGRNRVETAA